MNCETPPDSLPDIKPFFNSSHTTATIKKEKCLQKLVKNDKNKKKINGLNSTFNNNKRLTVLKKINLKVNRINEFSDKNSLTKNRKNHITSKNFLGSEKSSMKSNGGKECLKKRLRASTIALSSASCKEHFKTISTNMLHRKSLDLLDKRTRSKQNNIKENYNGISNHLNVTLNGNSAEQTLTSKLRNIMNKKLNVTPSMINGKLKNSINDTSKSISYEIIYYFINFDFKRKLCKSFFFQANFQTLYSSVTYNRLKNVLYGAFCKPKSHYSIFILWVKFVQTFMPIFFYKNVFFHKLYYTG